MVGTFVLSMFPLTINYSIARIGVSLRARLLKALRYLYRRRFILYQVRASVPSGRFLAYFGGHGLNSREIAIYHSPYPFPCVLDWYSDSCIAGISFVRASIPSGRCLVYFGGHGLTSREIT